MLARTALCLSVKTAKRSIMQTHRTRSRGPDCLVLKIFLGLGNANRERTRVIDVRSWWIPNRRRGAAKSTVGEIGSGSLFADSLVRRPTFIYCATWVQCSACCVKSLVVRLVFLSFVCRTVSLVLDRSLSFVYLWEFKTLCRLAL